MKKFIFYFLFFLMLFGLTAIADEQVNGDYSIDVTINIPQAKGPFLAAQNTKNLKEQFNYYKIGVKYYEKLTEPSKTEVTTLSAIYNIMADNQKKQKKVKDAFNYYFKAYENLKLNSMHKDSPLGYLILQNIYFLAEDKHYDENQKIAIEAIEDDQMGLAYVHNSIYTFVADYYDKIKNPSKAQMYRNKIVRKQVTLSFNNDFLKDIKYDIKDDVLAGYLYEVNTSNDYDVKQQNYAFACQYLQDMYPIPIGEIQIYSAIKIKMADEQKSLYNFQTAAILYKEAFENLKREILHKNNEVAFYCLIMLNYLSQILPNEDLHEYVVNNIEESQEEIIKKYPDFYRELSRYYQKKGNLLKAGYYNNLFNKK